MEIKYCVFCAINVNVNVDKIYLSNLMLIKWLWAMSYLTIEWATWLLSELLDYWVSYWTIEWATRLLRLWATGLLSELLDYPTKASILDYPTKSSRQLDWFLTSDTLANQRHNPLDYKLTYPFISPKQDIIMCDGWWWWWYIEKGSFNGFFFISRFKQSTVMKYGINYYISESNI